MRPATITFVRGLVMFIFLVAVPLVAVLDSRLPGRLAQAFQSCFSCLATRIPPPSLSRTPPLPGRGVNLRLDAPGVSAADPAVVSQVGHGPAVAAASQPPESLPKSVAQASAARPLVCVPTSNPQGCTGTRPEAERAVPASPRPLVAVPTAHHQPAPTPATDPTHLATSSQDGFQPYRAIEQRLRQLGAVYYKLERWGEYGQLYRFQCKVPVNGNENFTTYFEATDSEPARAMQKVLAQVEAHHLAH